MYSSVLAKDVKQLRLAVSKGMGSYSQVSCSFLSVAEPQTGEIRVSRILPFPGMWAVTNF